MNYCVFKHGLLIGTFPRETLQNYPQPYASCKPSVAHFSIMKQSPLDLSLCTRKTRKQVFLRNVSMILRHPGTLI